ncbi:hypothetical protein AIOL_002124 [Candidatus Rhodobacter oscarellae]|uniref:Uncharacterized protein n=1 Tax=Candidatus Rhodobacter oscarellae TaxID=1675527 RepID=A0A0J9GUB8_9RHOB|nr:hypothetical protein AIOL_002124 [Candidatus Rhodobacter lobularis]
MFSAYSAKSVGGGPTREIAAMGRRRIFSPRLVPQVVLRASPYAC